jgi:hypothetical protein
LVQVSSFLLAVLYAPSFAVAARAKPNIIFLFTDDQHYDAIGAVFKSPEH